MSISNTARDYAWGSRTLIPELEGREPSGRPEAEVWFGDHPGSPTVTEDGVGLDAWIAEHGRAYGIEGRLPYLLKLLAAGSPLSIQVHPSKAQAEEGFAREAGLADGVVRNYVDDNHKPEMIVALSERFEGMCGLREAARSRRLLSSLGEAARPVIDRIPDDASLKDAIAWLLSGDAAETVDAVIDALDGASSTEYAAQLANARHIASVYPSDPGVVVALLMNHVVLKRGEAMFLSAGVLHAYVSGLGVEIMAASDNVLRGGLTPKHIDVDELMSILDATPGPTPVLLPVSANSGSRGVESFPVPVKDFELLRARVAGLQNARIVPRGPAIVLVTQGTVTVEQDDDTRVLAPGQAVFATPGSPLLLSGAGTAFIAQPGE